MHRVQFDFSTDALNRLDALREKTEAVSNAEVVRNALRLYEYLIEKLEQNYTIQIVNGESAVQLEPMRARGL